MRLYHFIGERFGLEAIRDRRLKIARINELNDPFEFMGVVVPRSQRANFWKLKNHIAEQVGIICLSRDWKHPLLWGHYAEGHRGLCLGFDVADDGKFKEVEYVEERPTLKEFGLSDISELKADDQPNNPLLRTMTTKFIAWKYESEFRLFCPLTNKDPVSDLYFQSFTEDIKLAHVIVGQRSSITRSRLAGVLGELGDTVTSFKARAGRKRFEVEEDQSLQAWPEA